MEISQNFVAFSEYLNFNFWDLATFMSDLVYGEPLDLVYKATINMGKLAVACATLKLKN